MTDFNLRSNRKKELRRNLVRIIGAIIATRKAILLITVSRTQLTRGKEKGRKEKANLAKPKAVVEKGKAVKENRRAEEPTEITQLAIHPKQPTTLMKLHPALAGMIGIHRIHISRKKVLHLQNGKITIFLPLKRIQTNFLNLKKRETLHLF